MHILVQTLSEYHQLNDWKATLCCDNKKVLDMSHYQCRRTTKTVFTGQFAYRHVYGHMDKKYIPWEYLSLIQ
jgi:hypothetical protein